MLDRYKSGYSISIHALREEGDGRDRSFRLLVSISIHARREEGDQPLCMEQRLQCIFLSTPSARRATEYYISVVVPGIISIHALREEGD